MKRRVLYLSVGKPGDSYYEHSPEYDTLAALYKERGEWIDKHDTKLISILSKFINEQRASQSLALFLFKKLHTTITNWINQ